MVVTFAESLSQNQDMRCVILLVLILLTEFSSALPTPESEEKDGEVSRKILGSSVVTSVSVIMDVGNGSQAVFSDAVGKPMTKPAVATQLASPINLLNPDRYEFYTFDDSGDLVKRLMTLDEIQGIIASGDGETSNYNTQSDEMPEKRVDDVVNNVQNVLKEEIEAHKISPESKPAFDTPDVSSTWSMILPAIFGNSGDVPQGKPINSVTAETIMIEQTTMEPIENNSLIIQSEKDPSKNLTETFMKTTNLPDAITETTLHDLDAKTESTSEVDAPLISVEITSTTNNKEEQLADTKTESSETPTDFTKDSEFDVTETIPSTTGVETPATTSAASSTTTKINLIKDRTTLTPTALPISTELYAASTNHIYEKTSSPPSTITTNSYNNEPTKSQEHLSTFFIIDDFKHKPESTTKVTLRPAPFTTSTEKLSTILSNLLRGTTNNEMFASTTEENISKENIASFLTTDTIKTSLPFERIHTTNLPGETATTEKIEFSSTQSVPTTIVKTSQETTTTEILNDSQDDIRFSTTIEDSFPKTSTESLTERTAATKTQQTVPETLLTQPTTSEEVTTSAEKLTVTELFSHLLSSTNIQQINSELAFNSTTVENENSATETSTPYIEKTTYIPTTEKLQTESLSLKPENVSSSTTDDNLVASIEQLISQAIHTPGESIENDKESEKISEMVSNTKTKPMSEIQLEAATVASSLVGTTSKISDANPTLGEQVNQAVDSLISQIMYQPSQTTLDYSTTESEEQFTTSDSKENNSAIDIQTTTDTSQSITTTTIIEENDRNRYEEIDLGIDSSTINYESKTAQSTGFSKISDSEILENSSTQDGTTNLSTDETKYYGETQATTEKQDEITVTTVRVFEKQSTKLPSRVTAKIDLALETELQNFTNESLTSSTENVKESVNKNNEVLSDDPSHIRINEENYNKTESTSEPFIILTVGSSSEYPDYSSTENIDVFTKPTELDITSAVTADYTDFQTSTAQTVITTTKDEKVTEFIKKTTQKLTTPTTVTTPVVTENINNSVQTTIAINKHSTTSTTSQSTQNYVNIATVTVAPKIDKPSELKVVQNNTRSTTTTIKPDTTWTLVSTVVPHKTTNSQQGGSHQNNPESTSVDLVPKPLQGFGLEDSTSTLDTDIFQFTELCNELAFSFWSSVTNGISFARSVIISPFAATSMLAMVFLGARGATSGEMNEILKLDDMVTFNPHSIFKNVIESIEVSKKAGVATSVFIKELYSDKNKGKLLSFYKERVKQFYDGHVEEVNFKEINDVIRRRTNLLVKRHTWGKIPEYLKDNNLFVRPPLAAVSANIFQTDCSDASTEGRDGEIHFVVLPSIRQRKLIPIPAVVWRSGFLAGYDPGLDATAVAIGTKDQTISTIFIIPGQQGISAPGDGLVRLEARLIESAFKQGAWSRLLRSLIPRPGLEVQIPRFSHKSVINATVALQRMGLKDLFNSNTADLKGLNGVAHELYLSDIIQVNTFTTCGEGRVDETHHSEVYPATTNRSFRRIRKIQYYHHDKHFENSDAQEEPRDYQRAFHDPLYDPNYLNLPLQLRPRQARLPDAPRLRFDRPFLYVVRHNPTGLILHMGRFNPRLLP